jgi:recombination protein RecT
MRPEKFLYEQKTPVTPRRAATLLFVRDTAVGLEVLMTRRSSTASFGAGAVVFPGGVTDPDDHLPQTQAVRPTQSAEQVIDARTAIREAFEELGVLLAVDAAGRAVSPVGLNRQAPFFSQLAARQWLPAVEQVWTYCRWTTDPDMPKRFDTRFVVAQLPADQTPSADETEQFDPMWLRPADALQRGQAGELFLMFPTVRTLQKMADYTDVGSFIASLKTERWLWDSSPRAGNLIDGKESRHMEHESPYGELLMVCPDGQKRHSLAWQHELPVALAKQVQRLTCGNGGRMTGPGTNTYIIGEAGDYAVIDPGPDDPVHVARIFAAVGKDCQLILCTHSHPDHSPAAKQLQALTGAPIWGLSSLPTAREHSFFVPDHEIQDGQVFKVGDSSLRAIHTPGHAANHVCFLLEEDRLLVSGDHVLNGSTTVVDPPDGNMTDYLDSLDRLIALDADYILPAHGYVLAPAVPAMQALKAHRLARETKLISARRANPGADMDSLLPLVYDDVPKVLWPLARRSLLAHWERVEALSKAQFAAVLAQVPKVPAEAFDRLD